MHGQNGDGRMADDRRMARAAAPAVLVLLAATALAGCSTPGAQPNLIRLGYFPNLTQAQPLFGIESGLYPRLMGSVRLETTIFNAGPTAMEALLSGNVDVVYVGPAPALSAIASSEGVVRIVSGSALGGASLVARDGVTLDKDHLAGQRIGAPQLGNTQDIALRHWIQSQGHAVKDQGGDVQVVNAANADLVGLFESGQIDGAWVPEPWATRLVVEGHGHLQLDESSLWPDGTFISTQLVTTRAFLDSHANEVARLLDAHVAATAALQHPDAQVNATLAAAYAKLTGKPLPDEVLRTALSHVRFDTEPARGALGTLAQWTRDLGYASGPVPDLDAAYDLGPLQAALARAGGGHAATSSANSAATAAATTTASQAWLAA